MWRRNKKDFSKREEIISSKAYRRKLLFSFLFFAAAIVAAAFGWKWLINQPAEQGALKPLRKSYQLNEKLFTSTFSEQKLSKVYSEDDAAKRPRFNGNIGIIKTVDTAEWRLKIVRWKGDTLKLSLNDIMRLPKTDIIFNFKCIEGWSQITHWGGVPLSSFLKAYHLDSLEKKAYIGFESIDHKYYVGIDMKSALHPQTILCYEVNGRLLPISQGYPLRLIIPVKYGIKHIKQMGTMYFSNEKPHDYWAERGYDYYSGL